ncbi:MAG: Crossover junction endodeoxyribonuclease RuvC [Phycisphaerae bacterium]|nr:Crossover junction endodeoxyribonuclease RuvC [Phycisphaerae bacterium]
MASGIVILGIDPGLDRTGYAVIDAATGRGGRCRLVEAGVIRTSSRVPLADRLRQIHESVAAVMDEFAPGCLAVEQLYAHYKHPRTAILMGHARGAVLLAAGVRGLRTMDVPATTVKKHLTGAGHASKAQVQRAVADAFALPAPPEPPDVADAMAIALCAASRLGKAR